MLSKNIGGALAYVRKQRAAGLPMTTDKMAALERHLEGCVAEAEAMECQAFVVPTPRPLPEGVVDLTRHHKFGHWLHSQIIPPIGAPRGPDGAA